MGMMPSEVSEIRLSGFIHTKTRRTLRWTKRFARLYSSGVVDLFNADGMRRGSVVKQARINVLGLRVAADATPYSSRPFSLQLDTSFHGIMVLAFTDEEEMLTWATEIVKVILQPRERSARAQRPERGEGSFEAEKEDFVTSDEPLLSTKASLTAVSFAVALGLDHARKHAIREQEKAATRMRLTRRESWDAQHLSMEQLGQAPVETRKRSRDERMSRRFQMPVLSHATSQSSGGSSGLFNSQLSEEEPTFEDPAEQFEEYLAGRSSVISHGGPSRQGSIELQAPVPKRTVQPELPEPIQVSLAHRPASQSPFVSPLQSPAAVRRSFLPSVSRYLRFLRTLSMSRAERFKMRAVTPSFGSFAAACILPDVARTGAVKAFEASVRLSLEDIAQRFLHDPDAANPMVERIADLCLLRLIDSLWFKTLSKPKIDVLRRGVTLGTTDLEERHSIQPTIRENDHIPVSISPPLPRTSTAFHSRQRSEALASRYYDQVSLRPPRQERRASIATLASQSGIDAEQMEKLNAVAGMQNGHLSAKAAQTSRPPVGAALNRSISRTRFRRKLLNTLSDLVSLYFSFGWDDPAALLAANRRKDKAEVDEKDETRGKQLWRRLKVLWYRRRATHLLKAQREFRTLGFMLKIAQSHGVSNALTFSNGRSQDFIRLNPDRAFERSVCPKPQAFRLSYLPSASESSSSENAPIFEGKQTRHPVVLFLGGGMGAGKSSILREVTNEDPWSTLLRDAVIIEADKIKMNDPIFRYLSGKEEGTQEVGELASFVHSFSTSAANKMLLAAVRAGRDVIMDGTLTWYEYVRQTVNMVKNAHRYEYRIGPGYEDGKVERYWEVTTELCLDEQLRRMQYEVHIVGVCCEPHLAVSRGLRRKLFTGRGVPISPQLRSHKLFAENFCRYVQMVDIICLYDTSEFGAPRLIAKKVMCPGQSFLVLPQRFLAFLKFRSTNIKAKSYLELYDQTASAVEDFDPEKHLPTELRVDLSGARRVYGEEILWADTGEAASEPMDVALRKDGVSDNEKDVSGFSIGTHIGFGLSLGFGPDSVAPSGDANQADILGKFGLCVDSELREALGVN